MMYWVIHILIVGMISLLFYRQFHADFPGWIYWSSLLLKLAAGVVVGLIFFHHYEMGDTIVFFNEAVEISTLPLRDYLTNLVSPSTYETTHQPRVLFFVKFLSFFTLITGNSYWLSSLYLSLISYFSTWYFVITLSRLIPKKKITHYLEFSIPPHRRFLVVWDLKRHFGFQLPAFSTDDCT